MADFTSTTPSSVLSYTTSAVPTFHDMRNTLSNWRRRCGAAESIFGRTSCNSTRTTRTRHEIGDAMDRSERHLLLSPLLHVVKPAIRRMEQGFDGCAVLRINRNANTHRKQRLLAIAGKPFANPASDCVGFFAVALRQNDRKLVTTISRRRVNRSTGEAQNIGQAAERPIA